MLIAGSFWTGSTDHGLSTGFRKQGWIVREIEQKDFVASGTTMAERVLARLTAHRRAQRYEAAVLDACRHLKPDVLFTVKGTFLSRQIFDAAREMGIRTVRFWPDLHFDYNMIDHDGLLAPDLFITSKSFQLPWLTAHGLADRSAFVPHGYNPDAHMPILRTVNENDYSADVRYIGNYSPAKHRWIEGLHNALPGVKLRVVGNRWARTLPRPLNAQLVEARAYHAADYALAVQTARINIAVHWGKAPNGWEDLVSTRTFEIPACGGFMLHIDNDEVREYFDVGSEIDVFSDVEELADKCQFYLEHDEIRRRMATKAHERCVPAYSYHSRAREIQRLL